MIAEGSGQNIFIVKDGKIYTNDENASILMGITRDTVLEICKKFSIKTHITDISREMIENADEIFFSGTASEITSVTSIDDKLIKDGKPGNITKQIRDIYLDIVHGREIFDKNWLTYTNQ